MNRAGVLFALAAYCSWGVAPLFWKLLAEVPSPTVLAHRVVWALLFFMILLVLRGRAREIATSASWRTVGTFALSGGLLAFNWFLFIYSVMTAQILQASLGYFINPLVNVLLGTLFLGERMRPMQWLAVALAALGVVVQTSAMGTVPWLSLGLAISFGFYGLVRKTAVASALLGSTWEAILLFVPALAYLALRARAGQPFFYGPPPMALLFIASGAVTALPLLCFSNAARRLPLSTLGFFQYLAPSMQFAIAVFLFGEPFDRLQLIAFVLIWSALSVFLAESFWSSRHGLRPPLEPTALQS
jgi:chloramphenicol-sensitive protein RarD